MIYPILIFENFKFGSLVISSKINQIFLFWKQSTGIIWSWILLITCSIRMITLSLYITNYSEDSWHKDGLWWNVVYWWIFHYLSISLPRFTLLEENQDGINIYKSLESETNMSLFYTKDTLSRVLIFSSYKILSTSWKQFFFLVKLGKFKYRTFHLS